MWVSYSNAFLSLLPTTCRAPGLSVSCKKTCVGRREAKASPFACEVKHWTPVITGHGARGEVPRCRQ